ncbi:MAG TPA: hypothetical protein VM347_28650 [Nonomuraea sp.]|nr:hypothetical protein [Nonomuraea sp.]
MAGSDGGLISSAAHRPVRVRRAAPRHSEGPGPPRRHRLPAPAHPSGLAAAIATEDPAAAAQFIDAYTGSGVFWNSTTRLLDGFKLLRLPETGINLDRVPGPRGPVSFRDLYLRQYMVVPSGRFTS